MATAAPLSAIQPAATTALQTAVAPPVSPEALTKLGAQLLAKFKQYEADRKLAELKYLKNARQYLGIYDPEVDAMIPKNRSRAYPKLTRVKCVSMLSRLMNLLFQVEEKNWTVNAPAVPDLSQEDLQAVLDALMGTQAAGGAADQIGAHKALFEGTGAMPPAPNVPSDDVIEAAIRKFAKKRAARLELEIEDQLQELGGNKAQSYVALCRKVLASGIQYGAGILRGPFVEEQQQQKWTVANGKLTAIPYTCYRPRFEFESVWDYYPDMSAKTFAQMDGQFVRRVMSKHQVIKLKNRPDFMKDQIEKFLKQKPTGNYVRRTHETELRAMGAQLNSSLSESNKYEALVWEGYVSGRDLSLCGVRVADDKLDDDVRATVWFMDDVVVKAALDPWTTLAPNTEMPQYHHFVFEEDESFLMGNGLPNIMRDSQMGICAATRIVLDQGSVTRVFEANTALLRSDVDITSIDPDMIIYRDDDNPATAQYPAIRTVEIKTNIPEMQSIIKMFQEFSDAETFVNPATGGDLQKGPSEPFRTAAGASMLRGDAALPFKDVVRNFDIFTESVIGSLITFNRVFAHDPRMKGEFAAVARGATSLIAKEVQGMQVDNLAQTLTEEEKRYLKPLNMLRARVRVRDMSTLDIVMNDEEAAAADEAFSKKQDREQQQRDEMVTANIRKVLSDTLKNIAQAGKNSATGEAATANVILQALEKGLNPDMLAAVKPPTEGQPNGTTTGSNDRTGAAGASQSEQQGTGAGGLEAATGNPVASSRPQPAAMPLH